LEISYNGYSLGNPSRSDGWLCNPTFYVGVSKNKKTRLCPLDYKSFKAKREKERKREREKEIKREREKERKREREKEKRESEVFEKNKKVSRLQFLVQQSDIPLANGRCRCCCYSCPLLLLLHLIVAFFRDC
jgi:hypothetical protein